MKISNQSDKDFIFLINQICWNNTLFELYYNANNPSKTPPLIEVDHSRNIYKCRERKVLIPFYRVILNLDINVLMSVRLFGNPRRTQVIFIRPQHWPGENLFYMQINAHEYGRKEDFQDKFIYARPSTSSRICLPPSAECIFGRFYIIFIWQYVYIFQFKWVCKL